MGQSQRMFVCALALMGLGAPYASGQEDAAAKAAAQRLYAALGVPVGDAHAIEAEQRIELALTQPLRSPLDFIETPLSSVMQVIAEEYDIPVQFDVTAMEAVAQSPDTEVTVNVANISLRSAMELIFANTEDLAYIIENEVLLVTTEDVANSRLEVRVYRVDDLILPEPSDALLPTDADCDTLIDIVVSTVEADAWAENGSGEGEIHPFSPGILVIAQTRRVHQQLSELFETLRAVKSDVLADVTQDDADSLVTRGIPINADVAKTTATQKTIREILMRSVNWDSAAGELLDQVSLDVLPSRVIVRHKPNVGRKVLPTLHELSLDSTAASGGRGGGGF
jgi:hypothetical protein